MEVLEAEVVGAEGGGDAPEVRTREAVIRGLEEQIGVLKRLQAGTDDARVIGSSVSEIGKLLALLAKGVGADRPVEEEGVVPVFVGLRRGESLAEFCDENGYELGELEGE